MHLKEMDYLKLAFWLGGAATLVIVVAVIFIASNSRTSSNIVTGSATLLAAFIFFVIQLWFELRQTSSSESITAEFTIGTPKPSVQPLHNSPNSESSYYLRVLPEEVANKALADGVIDLSGSYGRGGLEGKLATDFTIYSLASFLFINQHDWQLKENTVKSKRAGSLTSINRMSSPSDSTVFEQAEIQSKLLKAGNLFANTFGSNVFVSSSKLFFPIRSTIKIGSTNFSIQNPVCKINFEVEQYVSLFPGYTKAEIQQPVEQRKPDIHVVKLNATTTFFALHAHDPERGKYEEWAKRLVSRAKGWLE